jgi:cytochrome c-type biogenesis protein
VIGAAVLGAVTSPGLVAAFGAGLLSFLSPCVLPLVPGYLSLMSGLSAAEVQEAGGARRSQLLTASVLFVTGFSLVFIAYGAVASTIGSALLHHKRALTEFAGVMIIAMGLVVANVLHPAFMLRERRLQVKPSKLGPYAAPVMGMAFAFGWTPCIGPVLAAVLTLAAARNTLGQGVGLLAAYSVGLGIPFLISGFAFGRIRTTWVWFKRHGRAIDLISGALLIVFGLLLITSEVGHVSTWVINLWSRFGLDRLTVG